MEVRKLLRLTAVVMIELAKRGGRAEAIELVRSVGGTQVYYALKTLMNEGLVSKEKGSYTLTEKGWKILRELQSYVMVRA